MSEDDPPDTERTYRTCDDIDDEPGVPMTDKRYLTTKKEIEL